MKIKFLCEFRFDKDYLSFYDKNGNCFLVVDNKLKKNHHFSNKLSEGLFWNGDFKFETKINDE